MFESLDAALDRAAPSARTSARWSSRGEGPSFCAGLDFPSFMARGSTDLGRALFGHRDGDAANYAQRVTYDWQRLPVPVIAALHGNCIGGGAQLALGADIRIAAPDVRISILEIKYGLIPDMGITQTLPRWWASTSPRRCVFTGRIVEGDGGTSQLGPGDQTRGRPTRRRARARRARSRRRHPTRSAAASAS